MQLPLVPLLRDGIVDSAGIIINSYSGISGAGKKWPNPLSMLSAMKVWLLMVALRTGIYRKSKNSLNSVETTVVQFTRTLPMTRGIATTIVAKAKGSLDALYQSWQKVYAEQPFVAILESGIFPDTKHVSNTNRAIFPRSSIPDG